MPPPPPPRIRIGFIGLSSKPDSWAVLAHLPYLRRSPHYEIVGLCNSTLAKAHESIAAHDLSATATAYATPADLAADPSIDLIVICTRVDTHAAVALPALHELARGNTNASKSKPKPNPTTIFIEWPLAATTPQARALASLAASQDVRTIIGLQARVSPTIRAIRAVVAAGRLGAVHSVNVAATSGVWQHDVAGARYAHFLKREVGGNLLTIYGIHILDAVFAALGAELVPGSSSCLMGNLRPRMHVHVDDVPASVPDGAASSSAASSVVVSEDPEQEQQRQQQQQVEMEKDTPDQIMLHGRLSPVPLPSSTSSSPSPSPLLTFHLRAGSRAAATPGATWRIYGALGELVVEFASAGPQIGQASRIQLHHFAPAAAGPGTGAETKAAAHVEDIDIDEGGGEGEVEWTDLPVPGQNIGRLYEAFARGDREVPGWDVAVTRHELIDEFWAGGM